MEKKKVWIGVSKSNHGILEWSDKRKCWFISTQFIESKELYVFTKDELETVLGSAYKAGVDYEVSAKEWHYGGILKPSKDEYIKSLNLK